MEDTDQIVVDREGELKAKEIQLELNAAERAESDVAKTVNLTQNGFGSVEAKNKLTDEELRLACLKEANKEEGFGPDRPNVVMATAYRYEKYVKLGYEFAEDLHYDAGTKTKILEAFTDAGIKGLPFAEAILAQLAKQGIVLRERVEKDLGAV